MYIREDGLDRALDKESGGTSRKDGQDRAPSAAVVTALSEHPDQLSMAHQFLFTNAPRRNLVSAMGQGEPTPTHQGGP